jgi:prepilin-type processing-associated H-X9-DG protein
LTVGLISARIAAYGYNSSGSAVPSYKLGLSLMDDSAPGHPNWTLPESIVVVPADMIALADWDPSAFVYGGSYFPCVPAWSLFLYTFTGKRHAGGANVVFCDAHVEYARILRWRCP